MRELRRLLADAPLEAVAPADLGLALDVAETGATYAENAALKARAFAEASGLPALADDSGIEVDALGGGPGPRSARYGGPGPRSARYGGPGLDDAGRAALMLRELAGVPDGQRGARYRAVVAIARPDGRLDSFDGVWEGSIGREPRGAGGFGYDPIFRLPDGRSAAELSAAEKDALSHRGQAVRAALEALRG